MDAVQLGKAGLAGWRDKVGERVAPPVSRHSPLSDDQVRALVGAAFFVLATLYVVGTLKRMASQR